MARLLADEQFPVRILDRLRRLGLDVKRVRDYDSSKSGDGKSDENVLQIATTERRIVLTLNRRDFWALHQQRTVGCHKGIIAYALTEEPPAVQADRIHEALQTRLVNERHFDQQFLFLQKRTEK
jgi:predicted nuclease of predicted toxin-antitoxin system